MAQEQDLLHVCLWLWQGVGGSTAQLTNVDGAQLPLERPVQLPFGVLTWQHEGPASQSVLRCCWHPGTAPPGGAAMVERPWHSSLARTPAQGTVMVTKAILSSSPAVRPIEEALCRFPPKTWSLQLLGSRWPTGISILLGPCGISP